MFGAAPAYEQKKSISFNISRVIYHVSYENSIIGLKSIIFGGGDTKSATSD